MLLPRLRPLATPRAAPNVNTTDRGRGRGRGRRTDVCVVPRAWSKRDDDQIWDEDERRRIEENKRWKRTDPPEEAWDIDKERDALMYKRESLEAMLRLDYVAPEPEEATDAEDDAGEKTEG
jgi:hypothetical protein